MNRTYLLDEITKIRRVIIEKSGKFTLKECESIAAALEVDNVSLVAMLEAIRKDLFPQKFVLKLKDAERFQLLPVYPSEECGTCYSKENSSGAGCTC